MKHVYTTGGVDDQTDTHTSKEVTINEVERYTPTQTEIPARSRQPEVHTENILRKV